MANIDRYGSPTLSTTLVPPNSRLTGLVAAETIAAGDIVYITSAGKIAKAQAVNSALQYAIGVAGEDASAGQAVTILRNVGIGYATGLTPGQKVYVSAGTAGNIDDAATATYAPNPIGFALDTKRIFFHF
jgi:hypothetical protein